MMKIAIMAALVACAIPCGAQNFTLGQEHTVNDTATPNVFNCNPGNDTHFYVPGGTHCYEPICTDAIADQINRELNAAFTYLYMATHFDDNRIARPGMAQFLYESANEERSHAIMMLDYLNLRGVFYEKPFAFQAINTRLPGLMETSTNPSFTNALTIALNLEITVTNHIYNVVKACDKDYHGADFFTEPILAEQHEGVRKLQGAIRAFTDLRGGSAASQSDALAEFIFDRKMLAEGI